jgi:hypothetical protein
MGIGFVRRSLVDGLHLAHDAVRADLAGLRHQRPRHDQVVELRVFVLLQHDAELLRGRVLGPEDAADGLRLVVHALLSSRITADRIAR